MSTPAVLHFASRFNDAPGGIWWAGPNEKISAYYTDNTLKQSGEYKIRGLMPDVDIDRYFDYLDGRMPYGEMWIRADVPEGVTPQELLRAHQKAATQT